MSNAKKKVVDNKRILSLSVSASSHTKGTKQSQVNTIHNVTAGKLANESAATHTTLVTFLRGRFVEDMFVYRQVFVIRSYQIGPDKAITMETLMNFLQETAINHMSSCGVTGNDFGTTREMDHRKLIWVAIRIQVQVLRNPKWGDEIEVDTWFDAIGKNGNRRDFIIRDYNTKGIIAKATSTWAFMNKETRKLSKMPEEVRQELVPFHLNRLAFATKETDCNKMHKLTDNAAERIRSGIAPSWNDMDANQHVNNVKYIGWILESVPAEVLENYNVTSMTLEFRRECTQSNLLESMTSPIAMVIGASDNNSINRKPDLQYTHLLRLQDNKAELVRARTEWHLKQKHE
ncbi:HotDog domain superfamily [Sesbania bispinosa]|nr:HotDog domain superfamily [Sesbania bispinosa]